MKNSLCINSRVTPQTRFELVMYFCVLLSLGKEYVQMGGLRPVACYSAPIPSTNSRGSPSCIIKREQLASLLFIYINQKYIV